MIVDLTEKDDDFDDDDVVYVGEKRSRENDKYSNSLLKEAAHEKHQRLLSSSSSSSSSTTATTTSTWQPFYLQSISNSSISDFDNRNSLSLSDIIPADAIDKGLCTVLIMNYVIDIDFLLTECPILLDKRIEVLILHGMASGNVNNTNRNLGDYNISIAAVNVSDRFGTHHSKMFMLFYNTGIRIVIQTSNICASDYSTKTQAIYLQDFPLNDDDDDDDTSSNNCEYSDDLTRYMKHIQINPTVLQGKYNNIVSLLELYNFKAAEVILIPSVPGNHRDNNFGHRKLAKSLKQLRINNYDDDITDEGIIIQISSIASLQKNCSFLDELAMAMCGGDKVTVPISVIWPTSETVRTSIDGYMSGGALCGVSKNLTEKRMLDIYRNWEPVSSVGFTTPHIKTFLHYRKKRGETMLEYLVVGSHNLSQAAWGVHQKQNTQLYVKSYEMSVLYHPRKLRNNCRTFSLSPTHRLLGLTASSSTTQKRFLISLSPGQPTDNYISFPIPYDVPGKKYEGNMRPFANDQSYENPDAYGNFGTRG